MYLEIHEITRNKRLFLITYNGTRYYFKTVRALMAWLGKE